MAYDFARSISQRKTVRECGYKFFLKYGQGYRTIHRPGTYAFGDVWQLVVEEVLQGLVTSSVGMASRFLELWKRIEHDPETPKAHAWWPEPFTKKTQKAGTDLTCLRCGTFSPKFGEPGTCGPLYWSESQYAKTSWKILRDRGEGLASVAYQDLVNVCQQGSPEKPHSAVMNVKREYEIVQGVREAIKPDYVGPALLAVPNEKGDDFSWDMQQRRVRTVLDWKTSGRAYEPLKVEQDEQLTDYQVGMDRLEAATHGPIQQVGLCVFIYTATPRVQWLLAPPRSQDVVDHFVNAAMQDERRIKGEEFARNPGACFQFGECDLTPVCYASQRHRLKAELTRDDWKVKKAAQQTMADW